MEGQKITMAVTNLDKLNKDFYNFAKCAGQLTITWPEYIQY